MGWVVKPQNTQQPAKQWVVKQPSTAQAKQWVVKQPGAQSAPVQAAPKTGAWNWTMKQLVKPVASASNFLEDASKGIAAAGISALTPATFSEVAGKVGFDPIKHQQDVWKGDNQRTYSTIMNEVAAKESNPYLRAMQRTTGYGGDFLLDPLNKVKIAALTAKGIEAAKTGKVALSVADQAAQGQRALLQVGKYNVLPSVGNYAFKGATAANDALRATPVGAKIANVGAAVSGKIRPAGVSREEYKVLTDAKNAARNTVGYATDKAVQFARGLADDLNHRGASELDRSNLLHGIETGREELVHPGLQDLWKKGMDFKVANEAEWKSLGGATLDNYGLAHVATKEAADATRKATLNAGKKFSPDTPQDIHRQWVKADGKIVNMSDEGIKYDGKTKTFWKKGGVETKNGFQNRWEPVNVEQASAQEINNALAQQGRKALFQEDLPIVAAKMGVSTGRKKAGVEFLEATKGLKSEEAKALANETYFKMTNNEAINAAIRGFDAVQNIWKAQALLGPSYHIRNISGNLWNNYLADVKPAAYAYAGKIQAGIKTGKLSKAEAKLVQEMEKNGIIRTGQFAGDIAENISTQVGKSGLNPFSQKFIGYRANRAVGSALEDNAKIAHFLSKRAEGYGVKEAADSVKKFLFDYGDLTNTEQQLLKRVMPFYTWTSKNLPLQVQQFIENPGKFSKIGTAKKDIEENVPQTNEQFMSDYIKENGPIRIRKDENGNTQYFLMGSWLPAAAALQMLTNPKQSAIGMITPLAKLPLETMFNKSSFFQNTLGEYDSLKKYPGQKTSYLGMDIDPRTANVLRSIRSLNEIDKLNPGEIFGGKNKPSMWQGILDNASNQRGGRFTPEMSQSDRVSNAFFGKLQNYNPKDAKYFYDRDTKQKLNEYMAEISRAKKNNQGALSEKIREELKKFMETRKPQPYFK